MLGGLISTEFKRIWRAAPGLLGAALLTAALTAALAVGGGSLLSREEGKAIRIAVAMPDTGGVGDTVIAALESMESVRTSLELIYTDAETAGEMVASGEAVAALTVPDGFLTDVMRGVNTPAVLTVSDGGTVERALVTAGAEAAADMLKASQCGIFALYDAAKLSGADEAALKAILYDANVRYIKLALGRESMIKNAEASATDGLSPERYMFASGFALFIMLLGTALSGIEGRPPAAWFRRLKSCGGTGLAVTLARSVAVSVAFIVLSVTAAVCGGLAFGSLTVGMVIAAAAAGLLGANMQLLFSSAADGAPGAVLSQFGISLALLFMSGGLIPSAFLPDSFASISEFLPASPLLECARGTDDALQPILCVLWSMAFLTVAAIVRSRRMRRE